MFPAFVSPLLTLMAFLPYIWSTYWKRVKPNLISWGIWTLTSIALSISEFSLNGIGPAVYLTIAITLGNLIVIIVAIKQHTYDYTALTSTEVICLKSSIILLVFSTGIFPFLFSNSPEIGFYILIMADSIGAIPTFLNAWNNPWKERLISWALSLGGDITGFISLVKLSEIATTIDSNSVSSSLFALPILKSVGVIHFMAIHFILCMIITYRRYYGGK